MICSFTFCFVHIGALCSGMLSTEKWL